MLDVAIIGGGPAGVAAANYARARGLDVALFERKAIGGLIGHTTLVSHYPSLPAGISGQEFAATLKKQLDTNGTRIVQEEVRKLALEGPVKTVETAAGRYETKVVILATGSTPKTPAFVSDAQVHIGADAYEHLEECQGKEVFVLGGSDGACKEALTLSRYAEKVHIVQVQDRLLTIAEFREQIEKTGNIEIHCNAELQGVKGASHNFKEVSLKNHVTGAVETYHGGTYDVFAYIGQDPNNALFAEQIALDGGYIPAEQAVMTGIAGVFLCGDINKKAVRQIATAVSDGAIAGIEAKKYIDTL